MSVNQNFPEVSPSLLLDFANSRTLDPRITFERSSIGTYVASNGLIKTAAADEARFDHDPVTGESLGLLIEEERTNIALNSEDFSTRSATTYGTKSSVTTNATIAPDGTQTADLVTTVTTTTQNRLGNLHAVTSGQYYTYSVYVKQGNKSNVSFYLGYTALINASMSFTFATETFSVSGATYLSGSAGFDKLDNGWYRIYFTASAFNSGNTYSGFLSGTTANETFYIWGEQIEVGKFPTSYIPTSGSTVTRSADVAELTGTNFSSWFNPSKGTFFTDSNSATLQSAIDRLAYNSGSSGAFALGTGAPTSGRVYTQRYTVLSNDTIAVEIFQYNGGATDFGPIITNIIPLSADVSKVAYYTDIDSKEYAIACADNINTLSGDGGRTGDLSYSEANMMRIGYNSGYAGTFNGTISRITYFTKRLTDSQLQNLTK